MLRSQRKKIADFITGGKKKSIIRDIQKLDIGCGTQKEDGYFGIDRFDINGVDLVLNLEKDDLPFPNNSIDHVVTYHALEHLRDYSHIVKEVWRVLKPNAQFFVCVPYAYNSLNVANIYHVSRFNEHSFRFFTNEERSSSLPERIYSKHYARSWGLAQSDNSVAQCNFRTVKIEMDYEPNYRTLSDAEKEEARLRYNNVVHNICFYLQAIKEGAEEGVKKLSEADVVIPPRRRWMIENNW